MEPKQVTLVIEKVINGARGLARLDDGRVVFVDGALPGETARVAIRKEKKQYLEAEVEAVDRAHPGRIAPPCPWYEQCGGCDFQHCDYEHQLLLKTRIIEDLFRRGISQAPSEPQMSISTTLPSPASFGYRQRIRLRVGPDGRPGFTGRRSHTIVPIEHCLVAGDQLNAVLAGLQQPAESQMIPPDCREVELLLNPITGKVVCLLHLTRHPGPSGLRNAAAWIERLPLVEGVYFRGRNFPPADLAGDRRTPAARPLQMVISLGKTNEHPVTLSWEVGGFCQVNLGQNEHLIRLVLALCDLHGREDVLDLFCGMGNFSIPLAMAARSVIGIEGQTAAIRSAVQNSRAAGLDNTRFEKADVHETVQKLSSAGKVFDCVVIDPPRQGVPGLAQELAKLTRRKMIYVSCDPATLCRDLNALRGHGLTLTAIQPMDMFPQTHHIETIALLEKN